MFSIFRNSSGSLMLLEKGLPKSCELSLAAETSSIWCQRQLPFVITISTRNNNNIEQAGTWPTTTRTDHHSLLHPCSKTLNRQSLNNKDDRFACWMLYKINNDLVDINPESFFHHSDPRTRGAKRLHQEQTQHHVLFHSLCPSTVSEWSLLPKDIYSAPSHKSVQSRLEHRLYNLQPVPLFRWIPRLCIQFYG